MSSLSSQEFHKAHRRAGNHNPGITITGNWLTGAPELTLQGSKLLVNDALDGVMFLPTANYAGPALLQFATSDRGNNGIDGMKFDQDFVAIEVVPDGVNNAPTIAGPTQRTTNEETSAVFGTLTSSAIVVNDDAGLASIRVTITAADGSVTLGTTVGPQFQVNLNTPRNQLNSVVAMNSGGEYVVAWQSENQDGSGYGVFAQRYTSAGLPIGTEFRVNSTKSDHQTSPESVDGCDGRV